MRERAHSLGGTVDIQGTPGHGTTISVALPLARPTMAAADASHAR